MFQFYDYSNFVYVAYALTAITLVLLFVFVVAGYSSVKNAKSS